MQENGANISFSVNDARTTGHPYGKNEIESRYRLYTLHKNDINMDYRQN